MSIYQQGSCPPLPSDEGLSEGEGHLSPCDTWRNLSGCYTIDTYHTRFDQRLNAVAKADLGEDVRSISARLWRRLPGVNWRPRQPRRRSTGGHQTYVIMLSGQAQAVRGHPGILHQCFEIGDVAVSTKARSGQALDPGGHSSPAKACLQGLLQSLPMQRRD